MIGARRACGYRVQGPEGPAAARSPAQPFMLLWDGSERGMIKYVTGDLLAAECEALVNSVNCVGVMGRGVALAFKRRFPAGLPNLDTLVFEPHSTYA